MAEAESKQEGNAPGTKKERIVAIVSSVIEKVGKNEQVSLASILTELRDLLLVIEETRQDLGMARPNDINKLVEVLGIKIQNVPAEEALEGDEALMNGPQMPDKAISQDDIDKLLAELDAAE